MNRSKAAEWETLPPVVFGVCWWNRKTIRAILAHLPAEPVFSNSFEQALSLANDKNGCIIGWASRLKPEHVEACEKDERPLIRVEDGFIRSVGLGAGLAPAASLVFDTQGIYYDATQPNDLETLLQTAELDPSQQDRGQALADSIIKARLSKYNLGTSHKLPPLPVEREVVLVPGQVADDAAILKTKSNSLALSGPEPVNLALLKSARKNNPEAFLIYKPHPDVASGLRLGKIDRKKALQYADLIVDKIDIIDLIERCDKVETISSMAGFEALLRGKQVAVHGQPFYAGWGLTQDHTPLPDRNRKRTLAELVYLMLVSYSRHVHPVGFNACEAEELILALPILRQSRLHQWRLWYLLQIARIGDKLNPET